MSARAWPHMLTAFLLLMADTTSALADRETEISIAEVRSSSADAHVRLDADVNLQLSERVHDALDNGLPLNLEFYVEIRQPRDWWWDNPVATVTQRYRLEYHELSRQYVIEDQARGTQRVLSDQRAALKELGTIRDVLVTPDVRLDPGERYRARARVELSVEAIPLPLRASSYLSADWRMRSDWYKWSLH